MPFLIKKKKIVESHRKVLKDIRKQTSLIILIIWILLTLGWFYREYQIYRELDIIQPKVPLPGPNKKRKIFTFHMKWW